MKPPRGFLGWFPLLLFVAAGLLVVKLLSGWP